MATTVIFETSMGVIQFELYWQHAPKVNIIIIIKSPSPALLIITHSFMCKTCQNFSELARRGYYNGTIFHRVVADFIAQVISTRAIIRYQSIDFFLWCGEGGRSDWYRKRRQEHLRRQVRRRNCKVFIL